MSHSPARSGIIACGLSLSLSNAMWALFWVFPAVILFCSGFLLQLNLFQFVPKTKYYNYLNVMGSPQGPLQIHMNKHQSTCSSASFRRDALHYILYLVSFGDFCHCDNFSNGISYEKSLQVISFATHFFETNFGRFRILTFL